MAYRGSLFERLSGAEVKAVDDEDAICQSIANNLSRIFSTNAGSAETVEDYGKPDLNNIQLSQKESFDLIERSTELCVQKYEPRLHNARAIVSRERLHLNEMVVYVEGFLRVNGVERRVNFKASLSGSGSVKVISREN